MKPTEQSTTESLERKEIKRLRKELYEQKIDYRNRIVTLNAEIAHLKAYIDAAENPYGVRND